MFDVWKRRALPACLVIWSAVLLTACNSLQVQKLATDATSENIEAAIPYILPKKTLFISATYVLTDCGTVIDAKSNAKTLSLNADIKVDLVGANEADESERYIIPYAKLRSWLKETNVTVESHANKTLKSFNGTINDTASSVITSTLTTAIKTAALVAAAGEPDAYCEESVKADLLSIAINKASITELRTKSKAKKPTTQTNGKGNPVAAKNASSSDTSADDVKIAWYQAQIDKTITEKLTRKVSLSWSPTMSEIHDWYPGRDAAVRVLKPDYAVGEWLTLEGRQWLAANDRKNLDINVVVSVPTWAHPIHDVPVTGIINGFVVRDPAFATVYLCKGECPTPREGLVLVDNILSTTDAAFPQLGRRLTLPLDNTIGQNSIIDITMSEDGVITKLGTHSTSTAGAGITALGGSIDAEKTQIDARNKAKAAALTAAQNQPHDDNKRLAECLAAQKSILENGGTPIGNCQ